MGWVPLKAGPETRPYVHEFIWEMVPGSRDEGIQSKTGKE